MRFLIANMTAVDLRALSADFLIEHVEYAYRAWEESPWCDRVDEAMFFNNVLPYVSVNERRNAWRAEFYEHFKPMIEGVESPGEAAAKLNNETFALLGVQYSRKRAKPDQSPYETIEGGLASCTGLSILLGACRAVGIPARFVGTPLWSDESGNHSWVEVWDDGWHITGAAEPTGMALDRGWFTGRAARARRDDPRHAIYASSFRMTPLRFPMVWALQDQTVPTVNVTDRYVSGGVDTPVGHAAVRFRAVGADDQHVRCSLTLIDEGGVTRFAGETKDERFDGNDHLSTALPDGRRYRAVVRYRGELIEQSFEVEGDEQLVTMRLPRGDNVLAQLEADLAEPLESRRAITERPYSKTPLTKEQASRAKELLWEAHKRWIRESRGEEMDAKAITLGDHTLRFAYKVFGEKPDGGRSLYLSMHGGSAAPAKVNTRQWKNQQRLYEPEEGVYLAPRAPTDTWNMWHRPHVDALFARLIENLVVFEEVNPDRVYIMGYSAGGDGAFQLAPRMADRWAAAAMMAGHPGDASPLSLRNTDFAVFMGGKDAAYKRNEQAAMWQGRLAALRSTDPEGYRHQVTIYPEKGHWMDGEDASALPWMASQIREPYPAKVIWKQDNVTHDRFYWLSVGDRPVTKGAMVIATRKGQRIDLEANRFEEITLLLNDEMLDLDRSIRATTGERVLFKGKVERTIATLSQTLAERGDPRGVFSASVTVSLRD